MIRKQLSGAIFLLTLFIIPTMLKAQPASQLIDSNTIGYARIDLQTLDVDATFEMLTQLLGSEQNLANAKPMIEGISNALKNAGATEAFAMFSLTDLMSGPSFFVAAPTEQSRRDVLNALAQFQVESMPHIQTETGILVAMSQNTIDRITSNRSVAKADIEKIFASHQGADLAVVIAPSIDQRKVLREVVSGLPHPFTNFSGADIADGASLASIRISPAKDAPLEILVLGDDQAANQRVAQTVEDFASQIAAGDVDMNELLPVSQFSKLRPSSLHGKLDLSDLATLFKCQPIDNGFRIRFSKTDGTFQRFCRAFQESATVVRNASVQSARSNSLRQCILACHNHHDATKAMPTNAIYDEDGNALLSWRVAILPWIEQGELYNQFKLDEPWNSEHNIKLVPLMPQIYVTDKGLVAEGKTTFVMPNGDGSAGRKEPLRLQDYKDGTSRTILFLDVPSESSVVWTKPQDWTFDSEDPIRGLFAGDQSIIRVGLADGSIQLLDKNVEKIKAYLTVDAGDLYLD